MRRAAAGMFAFLEVPQGSHRGYNEFHQLDHLPEQYSIDGIIHGDRWVATPACVAARPRDNEELGRAQYLALYLMSEPVEEALDGLRRLAGDLRAADRAFDQRETRTFGGWRVTDTVVAPRARVTAGVVPWRPSTGVHLVVQPAAGPAPDLAAVVGHDGVAGCWTFDPDPTGFDGWSNEPYRFTLAWLDGDPVATGRRIATAGADDAVFSGTYETIRPGSWDWFD